MGLNTRHSGDNYSGSNYHSLHWWLTLGCPSGAYIKQAEWNCVMLQGHFGHTVRTGLLSRSGIKPQQRDWPEVQHRHALESRKPLQSILYLQGQKWSSITKLELVSYFDGVTMNTLGKINHLYYSKRAYLVQSSWKVLSLLCRGLVHCPQEADYCTVVNFFYWSTRSCF